MGSFSNRSYKHLFSNGSFVHSSIFTAGHFLRSVHELISFVETPSVSVISLVSLVVDGCNSISLFQYSFSSLPIALNFVFSTALSGLYRRLTCYSERPLVSFMKKRIKKNPYDN